MQGQSTGRYVQTDTTIVIRYADRQGVEHEVTYRILENGRVLRAVEGSFAPRNYEYVRD